MFIELGHLPGVGGGGGGGGVTNAADIMTGIQGQGLKQTGRQTDRQTGCLAGRQADRQAGRDRQTETERLRQTNKGRRTWGFLMPMCISRGRLKSTTF